LPEYLAYLAKLTPSFTPLQRLSASGQWLYSLEYAAEMINTLGGAGTFLSLSPTLIRRFLLEQMVCIDVFGECVRLAMSCPTG